MVRYDNIITIMSRRSCTGPPLGLVVHLRVWSKFGVLAGWSFVRDQRLVVNGRRLPCSFPKPLNQPTSLVGRERPGFE